MSKVDVLDASGQVVSGPSKKRFRLPSLGLIFFCVMVAWGIEIFDLFLGGSLDAFGIHPRTGFGLVGVLTMPWLHGNFAHLISNTVTFVILGYLMHAAEQTRFVKTSFLIILLSGVGTWLIGRTGSVHIGASALIYGYFGYLVTRAFLEKRVLWVLFGIVLLVLYGGMFWGVLPLEKGVSWEGHLMGLIAGHWMARRNVKKK